MKRLLFIVAALIVLAIASFVIWPWQSKSRIQPKLHAASARTGQPATLAISAAAAESPATVETRSAPTAPQLAIDSTLTAIVPPFVNSSAVKNAEGLVAHEIADLGDGRGLIDRRFRYNDKGQIAVEVRLNPTTGQLIETVEYVRTEDAKINTRITDSAGNITLIALDGRVIRSDGTGAN